MMAEFKKYRVMIVEPSEIVSAGLVPAIESSGEFSVSAVTSSLHAQTHDSTDADILVINPSADGYETVWKLRHNARRRAIVLLAHTALPESVADSADAIIGLYDSHAAVIRKLRGAMGGIAAESGNSEDTNELSTREKEIITAVAQGLTNKEIADMYSISVHTVMTHRRNITAKLGINSISGLTVYAVINKLIEI